MKTETTEWSLKNFTNDFETSSYQQTVISPRYAESLFSFQHGERISGRVSTFITPDMELSKLDIKSETNLLTLQCDDAERCVGSFVYRGSIRSEFLEFDTALGQTKQHHSFLHLKSTGSRHTIAAGETSVLYVNVKPEVMHKYMPEWQQYSEKLSGKKFRNHYYISPSLLIQHNNRLQRVLLSLYSDVFAGITRSLFMEAKVMELLALQLDEVIQSADQPVAPVVISQSDYDKLMAMHEYINVHYLEPLSLSSLARQFLLNEFKLKKGFKQLFKQSAFNYIHTLRMEKAQELLRSGDMMVNEVSDMVGYSSIHNFSNAFYKMYKYRPNTIKPEPQKITV